MGKMVRARAGIFDKLEPEPHNGPAPQHCKEALYFVPHALYGAGNASKSSLTLLIIHSLGGT
jgi:hypothetical protein